MSASPHKVEDILDCLDALADEREKVSIGHVIGAFGTRTFGPAIMVPALLELTPVGAIPGVPTFLAVTIILVAAQKLVGRRSLWLPGLIGNRCVSSKKLAKGVDKLRPMARFMDRHFHKRLKVLTRAPFSRIAAGLVILLCLTVPFLEVLPFASSIPMLAIAMFGLAALVRDGVLMLVALTASLGAMGALGYDYWDGGLSDTEAVDGLVDQQDIDAMEESADKASEAAEQAGEEIEAAAMEAGQKAGETAEKAGEQMERAADEVRERATEAASGE